MPAFGHDWRANQQMAQPYCWFRWVGMLEGPVVAILATAAAVWGAHSGLHNAHPATWLQPRARYRHRELKWQFCHIVQGDFQPLLAKHTKNFDLTRSLSVGIDDMQRNFEPMVKAVELWRESQLTDVSAKMISESSASLRELVWA